MSETYRIKVELIKVSDDGSERTIVSSLLPEQDGLDNALRLFFKLGHAGSKQKT